MCVIRITTALKYFSFLSSLVLFLVTCFLPCRTNGLLSAHVYKADSKKTCA